jgi:hypothetical protein
MIAIILVLHLSVMTRGGPAVTYENVPPDVVRVSVHDWTDGELPWSAAAEVGRDGRRILIRAESGRRRVVVMERADGAYLLDGPFSWP